MTSAATLVLGLVLGVGAAAPAVAGSGDEAGPAAALGAPGMAAPNAGALGLETIGVDEIRPGMRGYGLSVFHGTEPIRFDVVVIDVVDKYMGHLPTIMVRCSGKVLEGETRDLDHSKVVHGMSGSPVFLDGRLAGAIALKFSSLPRDAVAGVTPIAAMLEEAARPLEGIAFAAAEPIPYGPGRLEPIAIPMAMSGFAPSATARLAERLGDRFLMVPSGGGGERFAELAETTRMTMGGSLGVRFMEGDFDATSMGTCTAVLGDRVVGFGHPMFLGGEMNAPMVTGYVHDVVADQSYSYKLSSPLRTVGALVQDRLPCVVGEIGKDSPMFPVDVAVRNDVTGYRNDFHVRVSPFPMMAPSLVWSALQNGLTLGEASMGDTMLQLRTTLDLQGYDPVTFEDLSYSAATPSTLQVMMLLVSLSQNPFAKVRLEGVRFDASIRHKRETAEILAVWPDRPEVRAGEELKLNVLLRPYDGGEVKREIVVSIPRAMPEETYEIVVGGGGLIPPDVAEPQSVRDLLELLRAPYRTDSLVAVLELPSVGTKQGGFHLPKLPFSVFGTLISNTSAGVTIAQDDARTVVPVEWVVTGRKSLKIQVKARS